MDERLRVRMAGYAPPDSTHSRALDRIAAGLRDGLGAAVEIDYNVLDRDRPVQALFDDVESGRTTLCYLSTSYLAGRVPALGILDLPYLFGSLDHAHACLDGELGAVLSERTEAATGAVPLGYWDNGFRHLSTRGRVVRSPADCRGLRVRLQPNWAHERLFRALGAEPVPNDLSSGIAMLRAGTVDAQENPLANFVAYGIHELHDNLTLTGHVYGARGVYASARRLAAWPERAVDVLRDVVAVAVAEQRVAAARAEAELAGWLGDRGTRVVHLDDAERQEFVRVAEPVLAEAVGTLGEDLFLPVIMKIPPCHDTDDLS